MRRIGTSVRQHLRDEPLAFAHAFHFDGDCVHRLLESREAVIRFGSSLRYRKLDHPLAMTKPEPECCDTGDDEEHRRHDDEPWGHGITKKRKSVEAITLFSYAVSYI
jgi:hypothetical protein